MDFRIQGFVPVLWIRNPDKKTPSSGFRVWIQGVELRCNFRVSGSGFRVQGSGCRVQGPGLVVQGSRSRVQGSGLRVQGSGIRVHG